MKKLSFLLLSLVLASAGFAQETMKEKLEAVYNTAFYKMMHQRAQPSNFPKPSFPEATPASMAKAHDAAGAALNFPDRVWFPGEWEEVKAIVVSPLYYYYTPNYNFDQRYGVRPVVPGYGQILFKENPYDYDTAPTIIGYGQYMSYLDVDTDHSKIFLRIMDAVQRAGAEAWVRIETSSDALVIRNALKDMNFRTDRLRFFVAPGNEYWLRDCGPICFYYGDDDNLAMLDFFYGGTRYADDAIPSAIHREMGIPNYKTDIIWEGGNCLVDGVGTLVTSASLVEHNKTKDGPIIWDGEDYSTIEQTIREIPDSVTLVEALRGMLGQANTLVLPRLENDGGTGHVDLYADAVNENGFLFTQMPEQYNNWKDYATTEANVNTVFNTKNFWGRNYYDMGRLPFPSKDDGSYFESEKEYDAKYTRSYANHCIVNNYIIQPCFSPVDIDNKPTAEWDRKNIEEMEKRYPGYEFYCIDMRKLDYQGGSIHCVTKQIPADNPIRILHKTIHGNVNPGTLTEIPFRAVITNKSGIAQAELVYRVGEGEWKEVQLTGNGNSWYCKIPVSEFTPGQKVEYYFGAGSNNGKYITKPLNAQNGSVFSFTLTNEGTYDETMFDFDTAPIAKEKITFVLNTKYLYEDLSTSPTTAISEVKTDNTAKADNSWYTISGTRLSKRPSAKGIYIFNGKKIAVK